MLSKKAREAGADYRRSGLPALSAVPLNHGSEVPNIQFDVGICKQLYFYKLRIIHNNREGAPGDLLHIGYNELILNDKDHVNQVMSFLKKYTEDD